MITSETQQLWMCTRIQMEQEMLEIANLNQKEPV